MTKTKSGEVRVSGTRTKTESGAVRVSGTRTKTKSKSKRKTSGKRWSFMDRMAEALRVVEERSSKEENTEGDGTEWRIIPEPKEKKKKPRSAVDPEKIRKTRLQTEKEKDAKVKISFPGGYDKDPRNDLRRRRELFHLPVPDHSDTSSSESDDEDVDPVAAFNVRKQCFGPHINFEEVFKLAMSADFVNARGPRHKSRTEDHEDHEDDESYFKSVYKDEARDRAEDDLMLSKMALAFFNKKHNSDYELVETLGSFIGEYDDKWLHHCNFKNRKCPNLKDSQPLSKLFFGELFSWRDDDSGEEVYDVRSCYVLDSCPTVSNCEMCPKPILHPKGKFINPV